MGPEVQLGTASLEAIEVDEVAGTPNLHRSMKLQPKCFQVALV